MNGLPDEGWGEYARRLETEAERWHEIAALNEAEFRRLGSERAAESAPEQFRQDLEKAGGWEGVEANEVTIVVTDSGLIDLVKKLVDEVEKQPLPIEKRPDGTAVLHWGSIRGVVDACAAVKDALEKRNL